MVHSQIIHTYTFTRYKKDWTQRVTQVELVAVREGTAILEVTDGIQPIREGDLVLALPESEVVLLPEGATGFTELQINAGYVADLLAWAYPEHIADRIHARSLLDSGEQCVHVLRLGPQETFRIWQVLDWLVENTSMAGFNTSFFALQAQLSLLFDMLSPSLRRLLPKSHEARTGTQDRLWRPLRQECRQAAGLMRRGLARRWTLADLAGCVHLSVPQLHRVFTQNYGVTPMEYLTGLRVQELARLLRETDEPVEVLMRQVGWNSRGHGARYFRQQTGMTPTEYRRQATGRLHGFCPACQRPMPTPWKQDRSR